jgi:dihydroorotate dehydrogenase
MGFNSDGMHVVADRLTQRPRHLPIGVNIGKNRDTSLADATSDYVKCMQTLAEHADYVAINISSPNTPGLRQLHETSALRELLQVIRAHNQWQRPIVLKISPDESADQLEQVVGTALDVGIDGIIATNTTVTRPGLHSALQSEAGGLSGAPVQTLALATLRHVAQLTRGRVPIIGVGGIQSAQDVYQRLRAGASLVQLYTALVYVGPAVATRLSWGLAALMRRDGIHDIRDVIGIDVPPA